MVLGLHTFDFAGVKDDPCTSSSPSKLVQVMISACDSGQFTCNDGQCVSIDERCNQISNCRFEFSLKISSFTLSFVSEMNLMKKIV